MAKPYREGAGWAVRAQHKNIDIHRSGFRTEADAKKAITRAIADIDRHGAPAGKRPTRTTVAEALQLYGLEKLKLKKAGVQDAVKINPYLRAARLATLVVKRLPGRPQDATGTGSGACCEVSLEPYVADRKMANGLAAHRARQLASGARTEKQRAILANKPMSEVTRQDVQAFIDAMKQDHKASATIALERSVLRVLFNHAVTFWRWHDLHDNPATRVSMPPVNNERERVLSLGEQELLDAAVHDCKNAMVQPVVVLLRETAMRASEPIMHARWGDMDWERNELTLEDAKAGRRVVPVSPAGLQALRDLVPGKPDEPIVGITYEALRAAYNRACERAGIEDLHIQDLRHTAATRMALKTGNVFLVKALTGHKTMAMVGRYINVKASDVVAVMHAPADAGHQGAGELAAPEGYAHPAPAPGASPVNEVAPAPTASATISLTPEQLQALIAQALVSALRVPVPPNAPGLHPAARSCWLRRSLPNEVARQHQIPCPARPPRPGSSCWPPESAEGAWEARREADNADTARGPPQSRPITKPPSTTIRVPGPPASPPSPAGWAPRPRAETSRVRHLARALQSPSAGPL